MLRWKSRLKFLVKNGLTLWVVVTVVFIICFRGQSDKDLVLPKFTRMTPSVSKTTAQQRAIYYGVDCNTSCAVRPLRCDNCFPSDFGTLLSNSRLCAVSRVRLRVLFLIHTRPESIYKRDGIRSTWASQARDATLVFVTGKSRRAEINASLRLESERHGDILQFNFEDDYSNVTLKAVAGLQWAKAFCLEAEFVVRVDDDVLINYIMLQRILVGRRAQDIFIGCKVHYGLPLRDPNSKWFVRHEEWAGDRYPQFCFGFAVIYSRAAVSAVAVAASHVPFFRFDDVYVTGLVATDYLGVKLSNVKGIDHGFVGGWCGFRKKYVATHLADRWSLETAWKEMREAVCG